MGTYTVGIAAAGDVDVALVGGKGAGLRRLSGAGFPVPDGFVVTTTAYTDFIAESGLHAAGTGPLYARIPAEPVPEAIAAAVGEAYRELGRPTVAVRSSGTAEDLQGASFAGQHDTYLGVSGEREVLGAVRDCWASLWTPRAVAYRERSGWDTDGLAIAVVVQRMVEADWAGVMFTADPVSGRRDRIVVEAVRGLGEALVSGEATGHRGVVDKTTGRTLERSTPLPPGVLDELARLGREVERAFGAPQDIEWALAQGHCSLVQARPLTALPEPSAPPAPAGSQARARMSENLGERIPYPPFPLDYDLFLRPSVGGVLAMLRSVGLATPDVDDVLTGGIEDVVHLTPPHVRPTRRVLRRLPARLPRIARALRTSPDAWTRESERTLGELVRRTGTDDLGALTDDQLTGRIRELLRTAARIVPDRFGAALPRLLVADRLLSGLLRLAAGRAEGARLHQELLSEVPSVTLDANRDIARLAAVIRADPELAAAYREEPPARVAERLRRSENGRALLDRVASYLDRYRYRELSMPSVGVPALGESPEVVHGMLASLAAAPDRPSGTEGRPGRARERLRSARDPRVRVLAPAALRLAGTARRGAAFREDSHYALYALFPALRRLVLELGARLARRGLLESAEDVCYLTLAEARAAEPDTTRATAARRRAARDAELGRYAIVAADPQADDGTGVRGIPASRGRVSGLVRIVRTETDFGSLRGGEVLVCPFTNPAWTPLFAVAAAVVVDGGGAASHAAIVAREYGIPAVMATGTGTTVLHDGQHVTVDGDTGTVMTEGSTS